MNKSEKAYKVCILSAGVGDKAGEFPDAINKGVLPVNKKGVISYIIEKVPDDIEIVIAVGHKKDTVKDYLATAHPAREFTYVEIENFAGPGSGPGHSLLKCKEHLQSPFIFCTSDTIIVEDIPEPDHNWIGIAPVRETEQYCTVKIKNNAVVQLDDKVKTDNRFAFIGLAGIHDHEEFFNALEQNTELRNNELQMVDGFKGLLNHELTPVGFTWFDTGSYANYESTDRHFSSDDDAYDFGKTDEFIYFVEDRVIKFFADEAIAQKRYERSKGSLKGLTPIILKKEGNFYMYEMVAGQTMYTALDLKVMEDFLEWSKVHVWKKQQLSPSDQELFTKACRDFYVEKTEKRLELFYEKTGLEADPEFINGKKTETARKLLDLVDWESVTEGIPSTFHGDLQFDNVLVTRDNRDFLLIDWRQDFGPLTEVGDLYYDLAKMYGGMILSYPLIKDNMFGAEISGEHAYYHFYTKNDLSDARRVFESFVSREGYDHHKIQCITAIIFLNMSPLHNHPFDILLHSLGRRMLHDLLVDKN